jgi:hypothetical protein
MYKKILFAACYLLGVVGAGFLVAAAPEVKPYNPKIDPASDQSVLSATFSNSDCS